MEDAESDLDDNEEPASEPGSGFPDSERRGPGSYDRSKTPEERLQEQRKRLLSCAARAFAQQGFAGASVATILDGSGLSRSTFYRHFKDAAEIFIAVEGEAASVLYDVVAERILQAPNPPEKLRAGVHAFFDVLAEHGDLARVLHREARANGPRHDEVRRMTLERFVTLFRQGAEEAKAQGLISRLPSDLKLYALLAAIEGIGLRYLEAHDEARAVEAAPELLSICFKTLG